MFPVPFIKIVIAPTTEQLNFKLFQIQIKESEDGSLILQK